MTRSPLPRKCPTRRKSKAARCAIRGCKHAEKLRLYTLDHPNEYRGLCLTHLKREADRLWAAKVKSCNGSPHDLDIGICELSQRHPSFDCSGQLQAAHGFSRRYLGTRYLLINGFALCQAAHVYWTHRPLEWDAVLRAEWGEAEYEHLRQLALGFVGPVDYAAVIVELSGEGGK